MKASPAWLLTLVVCAAGAQPGRPDAATVEQLQRTWLQCDRLAAATLIDPATAADCSIVHEQLLRRGFGGDFGRLLAWWREQKEKGAPAAPLHDAGARRLTR